MSLIGFSQKIPQKWNIAIFIAAVQRWYQGAPVWPGAGGEEEIWSQGARSYGNTESVLIEISRDVSH